MKKTRFILPILIVLVLCVQLAVPTFAGTIIQFSNNNPKVGDTVTVTVNVTDSDVAGVDFNISYDSSILTYKGCSGSGTTSYSSGHVVGYYGEGSSGSYSTTLTFTVNKAGSTTIQVGGVTISDSKYNEKTISGAAATMKAGSSETTTKAPETTTKAPETTTKKEETTTKKEETTSETTTEANNDEIILNGKTYKFVDDSAFVDAPDGFDETYSDYKGTKILTYTSKDKSQKIVCLTDGDGKKIFALFDDEKDTFSEYIRIKNSDIPLVLIPAKEGIIPEDFTPVNIKINDKDVAAYENVEFKANGIYLVYALNLKDGKAGLYIYDSNDSTIQKYYGVSVVPVIETVTEPTTETANRTDEDSKISLKKQTMIKVICALAVLLCAAFIAIVTLAVKLKKRMNSVEDTGMYIIEETDNYDDYTE